MVEVSGSSPLVPTILKNLKETLHFFTTFLTKPNHIGSVVPSSRFLAKAMVHDLVLKPEDGVLELGPGTGPLTKCIADILPNPEAFLAIDREASFIAILKKQYPQLKFVQGEAQNMAKICGEQLHYPVRVVLSALPFTLFDESLQDEILKALWTISSPGTIFRTFQYAHSYPWPQARRLRKRVSEIFKSAPTKILVFRNAPPAFAVSWIRK